METVNMNTGGVGKSNSCLPKGQRKKTPGAESHHISFPSSSGDKNRCDPKIARKLSLLFFSMALLALVPAVLTISGVVAQGSDLRGLFEVASVVGVGLCIFMGICATKAGEPLAKTIDQIS